LSYTDTTAAVLLHFVVMTQMHPFTVLVAPKLC